MAHQLLTLHELERRLLRWTGSSFVPRYPFFDTPVTPQSLSDKHIVSNFQDLQRWFNDIELAANDCDIPLEQYPDVAIYFLRGDLREVMCQRREVYLKQTRRVFWNWMDFKEDLRRIVVILSPTISNLPGDVMERLRRAHPYIASSVKLGLVIGGTAVLLPALGMMAWNKFQSTQNESPNTLQ